MNLRFLTFFIIIVILPATGYYLFFQRSNENVILDQKSSGNMTIESSAFRNNELIPSKYTCDGDNINPPLDIKGAPKGTKSLVFIVDDPDAPGGTWVHWTVWNISPDTAEIAEGSSPVEGVEGETDFGRPGYGGPCPPSGAHRYFFKVYALDGSLNLSPQARKPALERAMAGHILDKAELIGLYRRN